MQRIRPILRWPGGKIRLLADILPLIRPHKLYTEAFGGGRAVFLAKPPSDATFGELIIQRKKERQVSFYTAPVKARRAA